MNINTFLLIILAIALLGSMIGASMVAIQNSNKRTKTVKDSNTSTNNNYPSRKTIFLPMITILGISLALLIIGYSSGNIVGFTVGFLLLFFGFVLLGSFLFRDIF